MSSSWETEKDEGDVVGDDFIVNDFITKHAGENARVYSYKVQAHLVLNDSKKSTWGMVHLIESAFEDKPGELCGTWSRSPVDGLIHIFLSADTERLLLRAGDKAAQHDREVKERSVSRTPPETLETAAEDVQDFQSTLDNIRKRLKGKE